MAYTAPRTWATSELVTAAMLNEQVRDNEIYLKDAIDNTSTGHDHDGVDSKQIAWANLPVAQQVQWITGAEAVGVSYEGTAGRVHPNGYAEGPFGDTVEMMFRFPIPLQFAGQTVHIKEIKFYGNTASNVPYFDALYLRRSDLDATATDDISYTTDIGNGSSGDVTVTIFSGDLVLADFPYMLVVKCAGNGQYADYKVYGFRVVWEF